MKRRGFLLAISVLPAALAAQAQQTARTYRVGLILTTSPVSEMLGADPAHPRIRALVHELRRLGYAEGRNLILDRRSAEGKFERFGEILEELLHLKPDILITTGDAMTLVAMKMTASVPIVMSGAANPVAAGIVPSLARPGGNITGVSAVVGPEIQGKRLQYLKEVVPGASRVAYLGMKSEWESPQGEAARAAARALGMTMFLAESHSNDYSGTFASIERDRPHAVFVGGAFPNWVHRARIVEFLAARRLPSAHGYSESAELGGLLAYATRADDAWLRTASYVDRILKGAKPRDLPIEQPTRFELVVNLKTARARHPHSAKRTAARRAGDRVTLCPESPGI